MNAADQVAQQILGMNGKGEVIDGLVGHSMGALIASRVAQMPLIKDRIRNLICLAGPFDGTRVAYLGLATASARQMVPRRYLFGFLTNGFLEELSAEDYSPNTRVIKIVGENDRIVSRKSATHGKADEKKVMADTGHFGILYHPDVHAYIRAGVLR